MTIKTARQSAGLTQQQLADLTGIPRRNIQRIESDGIKLSNLTAGNFLAICKVLGVDPFDLITD